MERAAEFAGRRLAVIEDGYFLDEETGAQLQKLGIAVICLTSDEVIRESADLFAFDGAIVDINFDADILLAISDRLDELDVEHIFATAEKSTEPAMGSVYRLCPDGDELVKILRALMTKGRPSGH
ncbi:hypothetical protein [Endobacterium cereale]|uniref:hypothetical protein n=1 Tax=Endobacterium cereale TaxID=2663029 RepID=UPI002B46CA52|nr:hypothetical protein [Endobacterium cereale]MEB2848384.1 hypothetical protein [Endobacterium cereale]